MEERNIVLDLIRGTEAAALAAAIERGRGNKKVADENAFANMSRVFRRLNIEIRIVGSEGEKDKVSSFNYGDIYGDPEYKMKLDCVVDVIDGTRMTAEWEDAGAISVIGVGLRNNLMRVPTDKVYLKKIAVGPAAAKAIDLNQDFKENIYRIALALKKEPEELCAMMLKRKRHEKFIKIMREMDIKIKLIQDGDVVAALAPCFPETDIDFYFGCGGPPEGIIAACGIKSLKGAMQVQWDPHAYKTSKESEIEAELKEKKKLSEDLGINTDKIYTLEDIAKGPVQFVATGITNGPFLQGVDFLPDGAWTYSIGIRSKTGTIRYLKTRHFFEKKPIY
ncbi:MAG: fructose-bisphosphatase class II family protein [Promethearchaeota archaeon]